MLSGKGIEQPDLFAAFGQQASEEASQSACPDDRDFHSSSPRTCSFMVKLCSSIEGKVPSLISPLNFCKAPSISAPRSR